VILVTALTNSAMAAMVVRWCTARLTESIVLFALYQSSRALRSGGDVQARWVKFWLVGSPLIFLDCVPFLSLLLALPLVAELRVVLLAVMVFVPSFVESLWDSLLRPFLFQHEKTIEGS
jgi:hypothetical protein